MFPTTDIEAARSRGEAACAHHADKYLLFSVSDHATSHAPREAPTPRLPSLVAARASYLRCEI